MPWKLAKEGKEEDLHRVLNTLYDVLRLGSLLVAPFVPDTAARLWEQLGLEGDPGKCAIDGFAWGERTPGLKVNKGKVLFPRIDMNEWKKDKEARDGRKAAPAAAAPAPEIPLEHEEAVEIDAFRAWNSGWPRSSVWRRFPSRRSSTSFPSTSGMRSGPSSPA